jgi:basic membrane protein A
MDCKLKRVSAGTLAALMATSAWAFQPGMVTIGTKHDRGFIELAYGGADRFKKEFGISYREVQVDKDAQHIQALRAMARRVDMVIAVGSPLVPAIKTVAREFPKKQFVLIDSVAVGPNIQSIQFREQEGSFLVGMAAAMKSKTHTVGFIGGIGIPLTRTFGCGFAQGARFIDPQVKYIQNMAGTTNVALFDPARGAELARSQFDRGVDVVFSAALLTSLGVLQQAEKSGKLAIGVDSNQNYLHPGSILTSMLKRVDNAVYGAMQAGKDGSWTPGVKSLGLKEGGVDWALDNYNRSLISPEMEQRINAARNAIINGSLSVVDYRETRHCPVS